MTDVPALEVANTKRWDAMHLKAARIGEFHETALRLSEASAKARYQGVTDRLTELAATNPAINPVPWWFVAIVSEREYGGPPHWDRQPPPE